MGRRRSWRCVRCGRWKPASDYRLAHGKAYVSYPPPTLVTGIVVSVFAEVGFTFGGAGGGGGGVGCQLSGRRWPPQPQYTGGAGATAGRTGAAATPKPYTYGLNA